MGSSSGVKCTSLKFCFYRSVSGLCLLLLQSVLLHYISKCVLKAAEVWYHSKTYVSGVKFVRCACCVPCVLYLSSVIFILYNVLD